MLHTFKRPAISLTVLAILFTLAAGARAAVSVGDHPVINFTATDGTRVTSDALKGRIVIVDFWATWCGPCIASMPHMIELNNRYASKGVQVIGISRDRNRRDLDRYVNRKNIPWPQYFDPNGTAQMSGQWGVSGIPSIFILSPEGEVLWTGHPARMDEPFQKALRDHPPVAPVKDDSLSSLELRKKAVTAIRKARALIDEADGEQVLLLTAEVPDEVLADRRVLANARVLFAMLALKPEANEAIDAAKEANPEAAERFEALAQAVVDAIPVASEDPQRATVHPKLVAAKLAQAQKSQEAGQYHRAYTLYNWLLDRAPATEAGHAAAQSIAELEADEEVLAIIHAAEAEREAKSLLSLARNYAAAGNQDQARATYQKILNEYEDAAECCGQAEDALANLE